MDNQELVINGSVRYDDIRRDAFDAVPRTLFTSGVVFLTLIVPLYFAKVPNCCSVKWCFRISTIMMVVSLVCCAILFKRSFRVAKEGMRVYEALATGQKMHEQGDARFLTGWERAMFIVSCMAFGCSILALVQAMFV